MPALTADLELDSHLLVWYYVYLDALLCSGDGPKLSRVLKRVRAGAVPSTDILLGLSQAPVLSPREWGQREESTSAW